MNKRRTHSEEFAFIRGLQKFLYITTTVSFGNLHHPDTLPKSFSPALAETFSIVVTLRANLKQKRIFRSNRSNVISDVKRQ